MRRKFKIYYPQNHPDEEKRGKRYNPKGKDMLVMNGEGILFLFNGEQYYPSIRKLSHILPQFDVVWNEPK